MDVIVFVLALSSWLFLKILVLKIGLAILFFLLSENSNNKKGIFPILTRIICLIQIVGLIIVWVLRLLLIIKH